MFKGAATAALLLLHSAGQTPPTPAVVRAVVVPLVDATGSDHTPDSPDARTDALYAGLEAAGVRTVAPAARRGIDRPAQDDDAVGLDQPRAALLSAKAAMRSLDTDGVVRELETALELLLRVDRPSTHRDLLADILLLRAEVALATGRSADAAHDLLLLARTDRDRTELHPGLHPPQLVAAFAEARAQHDDAQRGFLAVVPDAAHPDVEVIVDGEARALLGDRVSVELGAGPHLLTVRALGRTSFARVAEVDPARPQVLDVFLSRPGADTARAEAMARLTENPDDVAALASLCELTGATAALILADGELLAFRSDRGLIRVDTEVDAAPLTVGRAFVAALNPPAPVAATTGSAVTPTTEPDEASALGPVLVTSGVALGVGVVIAAIVTGVVIVAQTTPPADVPKPINFTGFSPQR